MDKVKYFSRSDLRSRGWTDYMIKKFMPEHDEVYYKSYYRRSSKIRLYECDRVLLIEGSDEFKEALALGSKRSKVYSSVSTRKRMEMIEWVMSLRISVPEIEKDVLIKRACDEYNEWRKSHEYGDGFDLATPYSDRKFLGRICTNYLRHKCTSYEKHLSKMFGKVGLREGHGILQARINDAIHEKYPWTAYNIYDKAKGVFLSNEEDRDRKDAA